MKKEKTREVGNSSPLLSKTNEENESKDIIDGEENKVSKKKPKISLKRQMTEKRIS